MQIEVFNRPKKQSVICWSKILYPINLESLQIAPPAPKVVSQDVELSEFKYITTIYKHKRLIFP